MTVQYSFYAFPGYFCHLLFQMNLKLYLVLRINKVASIQHWDCNWNCMGIEIFGIIRIQNPNSSYKFDSVNKTPASLPVVHSAPLSLVSFITMICFLLLGPGFLFKASHTPLLHISGSYFGVEAMGSEDTGVQV